MCFKEERKIAVSLVNSARVCKQTRHCCQSQERGTAMAAQCQQTSRQSIRSRILNCYNFYTELFMLVDFNLRSAPHLWALPRQVITQRKWTCDDRQKLQESHPYLAPGKMHAFRILTDLFLGVMSQYAKTYYECFCFEHVCLSFEHVCLTFLNMCV